MLDGIRWNLFHSNSFIQHFLAFNNKNNVVGIRLEWVTIQHLISRTTSNVDFNVFERSNAYSNVFIKKNKRWSYSFSSQFHSTSIISSSEEETSPVKGRAFKAHLKDKEKHGKVKMGQEMVDDKMAEGKNTAKGKKDKVSKGKGAIDWKKELAFGMLLTKIIQNVMLKIKTWC